MCAITGSPNIEKAFNLYQEGLKRGHSSSGILFFNKKDFVVKRQKEPFTLEYLQTVLTKMEGEPQYYLLHSRAPTNTTNQEFNEECSHPFNYKNYFVAHNGIITNFKDMPESKFRDVDSSVIPLHLYDTKGDFAKVYERYTGLLTSWVFNQTLNEAWVVKAGSSLFMDDDSFSSVQFEGSHPVIKDGVVYKICTGNGTIFKEALQFEYNNPYFVL
jgi:predicted glutamine amidotransferase